MKLRLYFKKLGLIQFRDVEIIFNLGTLEAVCDELKIDFWQIPDYMKINDADFSAEMLYQGYITACEKNFRKPKFSRAHAYQWVDNLGAKEKNKYIEMLTVLFGKFNKAYKQEDKKKETTG